MQPRASTLVAALFSGALFSGTLGLPVFAYAQMLGGPSAGSFNSPDTVRKEAPPPALPGAQQQGTAAPGTQSPSEMAPNDALFDAINRDDVAAARDALGRGAQLDAHDVLGLTPMELAVDLGRNDIAFLLLSMRGGSDAGTSSAAPQQLAGPAAKAPAAPARAAKRPAVVAARLATPVVPPAAPAQPVLFAHDGGTPIPGIGFLGFDPQRAAR